MSGEELTNGNIISIPAGVYHLAYYSASSGTGKLQFAPDGSSFHDVSYTSKIATDDIEITIGDTSTGKWKAIISGDMKMYLLPLNPR